MVQVHSFLTEPDKLRNKEELANSKETGLLNVPYDKEEENAFKVSIECTLRDQMGNIPQDSPSTLDIEKCAYVKLINVPNVLDIGGTKPDPTDESLTLSAIDYPTLSEISQEELVRTLG